MMSVPYKFGSPTLIEVTSPQGLPTGRSFVIQFFEDYTVQHEGDERSRQSPGHGYPAYTEHILKIRMFATKNQQEWNEAIQALHLGGRNHTDYVAFVADRAMIKTQVQVDIIV